MNTVSPLHGPFVLLWISGSILTWPAVFSRQQDATILLGLSLVECSGVDVKKPRACSWKQVGTQRVEQTVAGQVKQQARSKRAHEPEPQTANMGFLAWGWQGVLAMTHLHSWTLFVFLRLRLMAHACGFGWRCRRSHGCFSDRQAE